MRYERGLGESSIKVLGRGRQGGSNLVTYEHTLHPNTSYEVIFGGIFFGRSYRSILFFRSIYGIFFGYEVILGRFYFFKKLWNTGRRYVLFHSRPRQLDDPRRK